MSKYINIDSYFVCLKDYYNELEDLNDPNLNESFDHNQSNNSSKHNNENPKNKEIGK